MIRIFEGPAFRYGTIGTVISGGYIIAYQSISVFMPTLMLRDLGADLSTLRSMSRYLPLPEIA